MKTLKKTLPILIAFGLMVTTPAAKAQDGQTQAKETQNRQRELAEITIKELLLVQSALKNFYVANTGAWPTNLSGITEYYSGSYATPMGTITGAKTTQGFQLYIDTNNLDTTAKSALQTALAKNNGALTGNRAIMTVDVPQAAAIVRSSLSRFADPSGTGELNTMYTDLLMNGNNIAGLNELNASNVIANSATIGQLVNTQLTSDTANIGTAIITQANLTNANIDTALIDTATVDMATIDTAAISTLNGDVASFATLTSTAGNFTQATIDQADVNVVNANTVNAALASIDDATIANTLTVNGAALFGDSVTIAGNTNLGGNLYSNGALVIDNAGKLYYQGQDLDTRFLGITDTAANADMLGGINASRFARTDVSNNFVEHQNFNNGITVGGTGVKTTNLDASGNIYANNVYLRSKSEWMSSTTDRSKSNTSRISALENQLKSGSGMAKWGSWRKVAVVRQSQTQPAPSWYNSYRAGHKGGVSFTYALQGYGADWEGRGCLVGMTTASREKDGNSDWSPVYYTAWKCE